MIQAKEQDKIHIEAKKNWNRSLNIMVTYNSAVDAMGIKQYWHSRRFCTWGGNCRRNGLLVNKVFTMKDVLNLK
jgi:hypothetical protein